MDIILKFGSFAWCVTHFAERVVVVEDTESDGGQDASKVEEKRGGEHFLQCLVTEDAVRVVGHVVRQPPLQIVVESLAELATFLLLLQLMKPFHRSAVPATIQFRLVSIEL